MVVICWLFGGRVPRAGYCQHPQMVAWIAGQARGYSESGMRIVFGADDENECTRAAFGYLEAHADLSVIGGDSWPDFARGVGQAVVGGGGRVWCSCTGRDGYVHRSQQGAWGAGRAGLGALDRTERPALERCQRAGTEPQAAGARRGRRSRAGVPWRHGRRSGGDASINKIRDQ